jgi:branched-chain amino acid transport system permease protein
VLKLLQLTCSGVVVGCVYSLVAQGFVVAYKATLVFNFAQGVLMMIGAYMATTAVNGMHLPFGVAVPAVILVAAMLGAVIELAFIRPMLGQPILSLVMITIGLSLVLQAAAQIGYGPQERVLHSPISQRVIDLGGVHLSFLQLTVVVVSVAVMALLAAFFRWTTTGLRMRAVAENHEAALIAGINANRLYVLAFAMSVGLAALGGICLGNLQLVSPSLADLGILAFPAAVIGGLESIPGAALGGIVVGVLEEYGAGYINPNANEVLVYAVLLFVLLFRPSGFFGQKQIVRL